MRGFGVRETDSAILANLLFPYNSQVPRGKGGLTFILNQKWQDSVLLLLWGLKCLLTTLLCRTRLTQWPPVIVRGGSLPKGIQKSNVTLWLRASIQKSRELGLESWLPHHHCTSAQVVYFSGPLFSSLSNATGEPLGNVSRNAKWCSCYR